MPIDEGYKKREGEDYYKVDESRYCREILAYIKMMLGHYGKYIAGNPEDEARVKRSVYIDLAIIFLLDKDAFYGDKHHFWDKQFITQKLRQYTPELSATDEEINESLERSVIRKRLVVRDFINFNNIWVRKWIFNDNYVQPPEKSPNTSQTQSPYTPPSSGENNLFESEEFRKLKDELDKL